MKLRRALGCAVIVLCVTAGAGPVRAADPQTPYIDQLREEMRRRGEKDRPDDAAAETYIDSVRRKLREKNGGKETESAEGYTEKLRRERGLERPGGDADAYLEGEKHRLGPPSNDSAIAAVKEGRSALHEKRSGQISSVLGLNVGTAISRDVTGDPSAIYQPFSSVYGTGFAPDVTLYYEHQFLRNENFGALGIWGSVEVAYFSGPGRFAVPIPNAVTGAPISDPNVTFQFFNLPLTVGLSYRMTLLRLIEPFAVVGPTIIGFYESRNDNRGGKSGNSRGLYGSVGVLVPIDWINRSGSWDAYAESGIRRIAISVAYLHQSTFSGPLNFSLNGVVAGVAFEY